MPHTRRLTWAAVASALLFAGCGSPSLSADSTCEDYLAAAPDVRHDAAMKISAQFDGVDSPGNPLWGMNTDYVCSSHPSMTLRAYFDRAN